jgi:hypothetical protein
VIDAGEPPPGYDAHQPGRTDAEQQHRAECAEEQEYEAIVHFVDGGAIGSDKQPVATRQDSRQRLRDPLLAVRFVRQQFDITGLGRDDRIERSRHGPVLGINEPIAEACRAACRIAPTDSGSHALMPVLPFVDQRLRLDGDAVIELQFERFVGGFEGHSADYQRCERKAHSDCCHQAERAAPPALHPPSLTR